MYHKYAHSYCNSLVNFALRNVQAITLSTRSFYFSVWSNGHRCRTFAFGWLSAPSCTLHPVHLVRTTGLVSEVWVRQMPAKLRHTAKQPSSDSQDHVAEICSIPFAKQPLHYAAQRTQQSELGRIPHMQQS